MIDHDAIKDLAKYFFHSDYPITWDDKKEVGGKVVGVVGIPQPDRQNVTYSLEESGLAQVTVAP